MSIDDDVATSLRRLEGTSESFGARLMAKLHVLHPLGCWTWTGATNRGYGVIGRGPRGSGTAQAHPAVYEALIDEIPEGMVVDHLCRNPSCCNPDHLQLVDLATNTSRGYSPGALRARLGTCRRGHPLDGTLGGRGSARRHRYCKTCARGRSASAYRARHAAMRDVDGLSWDPQPEAGSP